ncbi:MAG: hypothetical protein EOO87_05285 [Pedobacter sp.]|nr:MAG: hypothetical protein EOO87_05285 [Pedobacter sp.]
MGLGFYYVLFAVAIFAVVFAVSLSILTIWFRNKAMRIISLIFTILAFIVYLVLLFTIGNADEFFGISIDKLFFLTIAFPLYLQCYFAMQNALKIFSKKLFFSLACIIILRVLGILISAVANALFRNSLEEFGQLIFKVNTYVFSPLLFAGISYVFTKQFHPNLTSFKELVKKALIVLAVISFCDEFLNMLVIYIKYKDFFIYDIYTYLLILLISLSQITVGCLMGLYLFRNKHANFSV